MSCPSGQVAYRTPTVALTALQGMRARRRRPGAKPSPRSLGIEIYRCPWPECRAWHHGSGERTPQPKQRRRNV